MQLVRRGRAVIMRGNSMLMCQRIGTDYWYLPGGKLGVGEDARLGLIREIREETGFEGCTDKLIGIYEHVYHDARRESDVHEVNFVFSFGFPDYPSENVKSREEHLRFAWIDIEQLHELKDIVTPSRFLPEKLYPLIFAAKKDPVRNVGFYEAESELPTEGPRYETLRSRYKSAIAEKYGE